MVILRKPAPEEPVGHSRRHPPHRAARERLQFGAFDARAAWEVGLALKAAGEARQAPIVVDIGLYCMRLLSFALPGGAPDNFDWVRRKRNVVLRFHRSSFAIGRKLAAENKTLQDLGALPERDYAAHGGSFPIR